MILEESTLLEQAVLQVLTGASIQDVEQKYAVNGASLLTCVEAYRAAGFQSLARVTSANRWQYWRIPLVVPVNARAGAVADELLASNLGPLCAQLVTAKSISRWWFMRKADQGPHLRLRVFGQEPVLSVEGIPQIEKKLAYLAEQHIQPWTTLTYEPETTLFGGPEGIELAHDLFYQDSAALCQWLAAERQEKEGTIGVSRQQLRPEASLLIIQGLLRGAGLDAFELWDTWMQVTQLRPGSTTVSPERRKKNVAALANLLAAPEAHYQELFGHALYSILAHWSESFENAGKVLAQLHRDGALQRGLRQILATHIIFHWNRFNFGAARQVELARMAEICASH